MADEEEEEDDEQNENKGGGGGGVFHYIKVHAPIEVLYNLAEQLKMKLPTRPNDINIKRWYEGNLWKKLNHYDPFRCTSIFSCHFKILSIHVCI